MNTSSHVHADAMLRHNSVSETLPPHVPSVAGEGGRALEALREAVRLHGPDAMRSAQQRLETLQECFLSIVQTRLQNAAAPPTDKLSMHLAGDETLVLDTAAEDEHLHELLTADDELQSLFSQMHTLALTTHGLEHLDAALHGVGASPLRYRACLKGALSHFYLR